MLGAKVYKEWVGIFHTYIIRLQESTELVLGLGFFVAVVEKERKLGVFATSAHRKVDTRHQVPFLVAG